MARFVVAAYWRENDVRSYGEGTKHLRHPTAGLIAMEYSSFAVEGRPDLGMVVYNPATPDDVDKMRALIATCRAARPSQTGVRARLKEIS